MPPLSVIAEKYGDRYGPYAFGIISLLILWFLIISPQQEMMKIDFGRQEKVVEKLDGIVAEQKEIAYTMKQTAEIMNKTVSRLPD